MPSEDSENLQVYKLPGAWQIGEWEAQASVHFLTEQTPKGIPLGLEMVSLEFEKETELKGLWEHIAAEWKLEGSPDWNKDENGRVSGYKEVYLLIRRYSPHKGYAVFSCFSVSFASVCGSVGKWISPTKLKTISTF